MHRWGRVRRTVVVAVALTGSLALLATACGGSDGNGQAGGPSGSIGGTGDKTNVTVAPSGAPKSGGKLVYGLEAETDGFNPTVNRWAASGTMVAVAVFDPLVAFNDKLETQPYLAESIEPSSDYRTWTIKLRSGVKFHNDQPLNAGALKKSIDAFKASALTGSAAEPIEADGVAMPDGPDGLTVTVGMKVPWVAFPALLTAQGGVVPAPAMLDDPDGGKRPIGTGPFVFQEWAPGQKLIVRKNQTYWRQGLPYLDTVEFRPTPDLNSRYNAIKSGDLDMFHTSDARQQLQLRELADSGQIQIWRAAGETEESMVLINTKKPPLDDVRVRRALAHAIDREALTQISGADPADRAFGWFSKDSPWYVETDYPTFDLEKAKALIAEYQRDHPGPVRFTFGTTTDPSVVQVGQYLQQAWAPIGVEIDLESIEQAPFINNALLGNFSAQIWRQFGAPDPDGDFLWFYGPNAKPIGQLSLNMARNSDPQLDAALEKGRGSPAIQDRKDAYAEVQRRQTADLPYLWLSHIRWTFAAVNDVRGVADQTLPDGQRSAGPINGVHRLTQVWRDR